MFGLLAELLKSIDFPTPGAGDQIFQKPPGTGPNKPAPIDPINPAGNGSLGKPFQRTPGMDSPPSAVTHPMGSSGGGPASVPAPYKIVDAMQAGEAGGPKAIEYPWQKFKQGLSIKGPPGDDAAMSNRTAPGPYLREQMAVENAAYANKYRWTIFTSEGQKFAKTQVGAEAVANKYGSGLSSILPLTPHAIKGPGVPVTPGMPIMGNIDGGKPGQVSLSGFLGAKGWGPEHFTKQPIFLPDEEVMARNQNRLDVQARVAQEGKLSGPATRMLGRGMNALMAAQLAAKVAETASNARERAAWHSTVESVRSQRLSEGADPQSAERDAILAADRQRERSRAWSVEPPMEQPAGQQYGAFGESRMPPAESSAGSPSPKTFYWDRGRKIPISR